MYWDLTVFLNFLVDYLLLFAAARRQRSDHYQRQQQCSRSPYIHHKKSPFVFLEVTVIILLYQT